MKYFEDIYLKRLNRYGYDFQTRLQGQREENFERQLEKSIYYVQFMYDDELQEGELVRKSQNETKTIQYLLTRLNLNMPHGTILMIPDKDMVEQPWLVYYLESIKTSGYNRYFVIKMTHFITWQDRSGAKRQSWAYMYGQEDNMLKDEIRSRSRMDTIYDENLKTSFFILPANPYLRKDDYIEVDSGVITEPYRVTGYDIQSNPGVEFVTVDPIYIYDRSKAPVQTEEDNDDDFYWLNNMQRNDMDS